jgi:hypothetical protein
MNRFQFVRKTFFSSVNNNDPINRGAILAAAEKKAIKDRLVRRKIVTQVGLGVVVVSIPISVWWYWSIQERQRLQEKYHTERERKEQLPKQFQAQDTFDMIISTKCLPGDVLLFDRKCEKCCASPWASFSCFAAKAILCTSSSSSSGDKYMKSVESGSYDHIGLIVPGYVNTTADKYDPMNLLLLEATPSGIVARPLKERIEQSASRSILLVQLNTPGEERQKVGKDYDEYDDDDSNYSRSRKKKKRGGGGASGIDDRSSRQIAIDRTRVYIDKELAHFRDSIIKAGAKQQYKYLHSTVALGGALAYGLNLVERVNMNGPISPSAYVVLRGLQKAAVAPDLNEKENQRIKVEDYLRDHKFQEKNAVRLRPGFRFLAPLTIKENTTR